MSEPLLPSNGVYDGGQRFTLPKIKFMNPAGEYVVLTNCYTQVINTHFMQPRDVLQCVHLETGQAWPFKRATVRHWLKRRPR